MIRVMSAHDTIDEPPDSARIPYKIINSLAWDIAQAVATDRRAGMHVLVVRDKLGDSQLIQGMLEDELGHEAFSLHVACSVDEGREDIRDWAPDILLLDLSLADTVGLDAVGKIQAVAPSLPIIVLTGSHNQDLALSAMKAGAQDFLVKSELTGPLLLKAIQYASERKQIEASLRVNEARFRSLAELSSDWYWEQDAAGRLTYISEGLREKSGIDATRLTGSCWWEIEALDPNGGWDGMRQKMDAHEAFHDVLLRYATDAPEAVFLTISGVPVTSADGSFAGFRGIGKDVSARERIDAALRGSEERYRRMMDSARDGILMFDADGIITFANLRICSMIGYTDVELRGHSLAAFTETRPSVQIGSAPKGGFVLRRKDGSSLLTMKINYPVSAKDGTHAGMLSIFTDISQFREREERIRQLAALAAEKSEAERANLAKSRFLAAVSHDLRQPMHALGLFVEDLRGADLDDAATSVLAKMDSALELSNGLLDTILVMSGLESGMVAPNVVVFPLQKLLERVDQAFGAVAEKKGLRLLVIPCDAFVRSDPALLERIIFNLVSNAIRYTDRGGVAVACRNRGGAIHLQVWDTGLGIPAEYRDAIFREFYRIEGEGRDRGGLGLGLAIVQSCASLLGHPLEVHSVPGRGSRFSVVVPRGMAADYREPVDDNTSAQEPVPNFTGVTVLVIDDDEVLLESTAALLSRWGCRVLTARSGRQAHAAMAGVDGRVDLVVSDLRLAANEMGTSVISELRETYERDLAALIVTGDRTLVTSREVKQHGLMLLYKPVPVNRLKSMMTKLLDSR